MYNLTFTELREKNETRCSESYHGIHEWSATDWATAVAGELGETCNLLKKLRRGDKIDMADIGKELADTAIYLDLLAARLGFDLGDEIVKKFNEVSIRVGSDIFIDMPSPNYQLTEEEFDRARILSDEEVFNEWVKSKPERMYEDDGPEMRKSNEYRNWERSDPRINKA